MPARDPAVYDAVAEHFPLLTQDDKELLNVGTGQNKWRNRVEWTRLNLVKKGELDGSQRGVWPITEKGRQRLSREWPPAQPPQYSTKLYTDRPRSVKVSKETKRPPTVPTQLGPPQPLQREKPVPQSAPPAERIPSLPELVGRHFAEIKERLSAKISNLSPEQFEHLTAEFLANAGYQDVRRTGGPGDRNIDVTATYAAPFIKVPVRVQVKHRQRAASVGPTDVAAFRDRAGGVDHVLLMVTNGRFTDGALETASEQGRQRVFMIDGQDLVTEMIEKKVGVKEGPLGLLEIDDDFFAQLKGM